MHLNLSTMDTLGIDESGQRCREVQTRVNVWTVCQKNSRCGEVAISGCSTVHNNVNPVSSELLQERSSVLYQSSRVSFQKMTRPVFQFDKLPVQQHNPDIVWMNAEDEPHGMIMTLMI